MLLADELSIKIPGTPTALGFGNLVGCSQNSGKHVLGIIMKDSISQMKRYLGLDQEESQEQEFLHPWSWVHQPGSLPALQVRSFYRAPPPAPPDTSFPETG